MHLKAWEDLRLPTDDVNRIWEVFHENSKVSRFDAFPSQAQIVERMVQLHDALPYEQIPAIPLPEDRAPLTASLEEVIRRRVSARGMAPRRITLQELSSLLYYTYGISRDNEGTDFPRPFRMVPSGGALYPMEIYFHAKHVDDLRTGLYHYHPVENAVRLLRPSDFSAEIAKVLVEFQAHLALEVSVLFFFTAMFERTTFKYGARGYRFTLLEAGHMAQNMNLAATAMGMNVLSIGGYYDRRADELLNIDGVTHSTLYMVGVGGEPSAPSDAPKATD